MFDDKMHCISLPTMTNEALTSFIKRKWSFVNKTLRYRKPWVAWYKNMGERERKRIIKNQQNSSRKSCWMHSGASANTEKEMVAWVA